MKEKIKALLTDSKYLLLSFVFCYIVPLILLVVLATESKSKTIAWSLWGAVVGFIMIIVYYVKLKTWLNNKKEFEKHEQLRVPVWLRVVQLCVSLLGFVIIYLVLNTMKEMFEEVMLFVLLSGISVAVGNILLIVDSKNRKPKRITRQE